MRFDITHTILTDVLNIGVTLATLYAFVSDLSLHYQQRSYSKKALFSNLKKKKELFWPSYTLL